MDSRLIAAFYGLGFLIVNFIPTIPTWFRLGYNVGYGGLTVVMALADYQISGGIARLVIAFVATGYATLQYKKLRRELGMLSPREMWALHRLFHGSLYRFFRDDVRWKTWRMKT